jgi:hypothetical protein
MSVTSERTAKVLELVVFNLNDGVTQEQFAATLEPVSRWIAEQPGFISRELSYDAQSDRWVDVIWWESMEQAGAAAQLAMSSDHCAPMFAMLDMESAAMLHGELVHSFSRLAQAAAA